MHHAPEMKRYLLIAFDFLWLLVHARRSRWEKSTGARYVTPRNWRRAW